MAIKNILVEYQAKNNVTGLTDVKAQIYLNGVSKAVAGAAVALTEIDATNAPGMYLLTITAAMQTTYGVTAAQANWLYGSIDSVSNSAEAPWVRQAFVNTTDDIENTIGTPTGASVSADIAAVQTKLGTPAGASVSADIAAVKSDTAAIKTDLETGSSSLSTILTAINQIKNNAGFAIPVPSQLARPSSGNTTYRVPVTIYNENNALVDPDTNSIVITLVNSAGVDRSSYLTGNSGGSAPAVRDSLGQYHIDVVIPSTATDEEILFNFAYAIGGAATARKSTTVIVDAVNVAGLALQSTLLSVQTTVNTIQSDVESATFGLAQIKSDTAAIKADVESVTSGNAAIKTDTAAILSTVNNGTYGNAALQTQGASSQGTGFVSTTDSLHALSVFVRANIFQGGRAV